MLNIDGKYASAKVFTGNIEDTAINQIKTLCDQTFVEGSKIRIMPDVHAGAGCTIGTTMTITNKIVPNLVGVDIGCGMLCVKLGNIDLDIPKIDEYIKQHIPCGSEINLNPEVDYKNEIEKILCLRELGKSSKEYNRALGSLGGGNHFIEINIDDENNKYLVIHSGSRNLGKRVADHYQNKAYEYHTGENEEFVVRKNHIIESYKQEGRRNEIETAIKALKQEFKRDCIIPKDLCYLENTLMEQYLFDMKIVQKYACINRSVMARKIIEKCICLNFDECEKTETIHNYIDMDTMILRKGAISAADGEIVLIPINMRDGSIIAKGKGNEEWNFSAPHGAGRLMSRSVAREKLSLDTYKDSMKDVYSSVVNIETIDEAPQAYKPMEEILANITDTVEILKIIKPVYNFKASDS